MADDLSLQLIIKAILDSKGFEEAKASLGELAAKANAAAPAADDLGKKTAKMSEELRAGRIAASGLANILLQQIGVTGSAGTAARAAASGVALLGGATGGVAFAITGAVAVLGILVPKIVEWTRASKESKEEQEALRDQIDGLVASLGEYQSAIGFVSREMEDLLALQREKALEEQQKQIDSLTTKNNGLAKAIADLERGHDRVVQAGARGLPVIIETIAATEEETKKAEELKKELADGETTLSAFIEAQGKHVSVTALAVEGARKATEALRAQERAVRDLAAAHDEFARLELAQTQEGLNAIADRQRFEDQQARDAERDMAAFGRSQDAQAREDRKKEAERVLGVRDLEKERTLIVKQESAQRAIAEANAIAFGVSALASFFGKSKAAAIAGAIADTYAAAVAAYKTAGGGPWGIPIMLFTIAQGLAQVKQIESQSVGFDDPFNDLLAEKLGRKSAADFVDHFGAGFRRGMGGGGGGGSVVNNHTTTINRGTNIGNISGVIGSKTALRRFLVRELIAAERAERRTRI